MVKQLAFQLEDSGSTPTSPLHYSHQYNIRLQSSKQYGNTIFPNTLFPIKTSDINTNLSDATVKEIDFETSSKIIEEYEWLGTMPTFCTHHYGIYFDNICGGVVVYGISLPQPVFDSICGVEFGNKVRVLSRGACVYWTPIGSASKLISVSLRMLKKEGYKIIIAYCDTRAGEIGTIYQACNFIYTGVSEGGNEYLIENKWRTGIGASEYSHEKRNLNDYENRKRSIKHRYIYLLGTPSEHKLLLSKLRYPQLPYPKRNIFTI